MNKPGTYNDKVIHCLHELAEAAREVPAEAQPKRLQDALVSLVALDVLSTGTYFLPPSFDSSYTPSAGLSS
jgi:hypothetical protein